MEGAKPPDLLIYVPMAQEDTFDALIGFIRAGFVMKPGRVHYRKIENTVFQ